MKQKERKLTTKEEKKILEGLRYYLALYKSKDIVMAAKKLGVDVNIAHMVASKYNLLAYKY